MEMVVLYLTLSFGGFEVNTETAYPTMAECLAAEQKITATQTAGQSEPMSVAFSTCDYID